MDGMRVPAIDFTQTGQQISQSVDKMYKGILASMEYDMKRLAEVDMRFASNMEVTQLNQHLQGQAQDIALKAVEEHTNKWAEVYAEKEGRLSGQDLLKMKQEQTTVEGVILRANAGAEMFKDATEEIRGIKGGQYDMDYYDKARKKYLEEGDVPEDGFLRLRPVDIIYKAQHAKRPPRIDRQSVRTTIDGRTVTSKVDIYATDDMRDAQVAEWVLDDPQFRMDAIEKFNALDESQQKRYNDLATAPGEQYILFAQDVLRDELWPNTYDSTTTPSLTEYQQLREAERAQGDVIDYTDKPVIEQSFGAKSYKGYDLSPLQQTFPRGLVVDRAVNTHTGEEEKIEGTLKVTNLLLYDPDKDSIIVEAEVKNYRAPDIEGGEKQYGLKIKGSESVLSFRGNKEEAEKERRARQAEAESGVEYEVIPRMSPPQTAYIKYELDAKRYRYLLEGINFPKTKSNKSSFSNIFGDG